MAAVAVTILVVGCGSSGAWSPEEKAELVEDCTESPTLEEMSDEVKAEWSQMAGDYGLAVEELLELRNDAFGSDPARCECLISIYEEEMTRAEFDSLGYAELERLAAKAGIDCL